VRRDPSQCCRDSDLVQAGAVQITLRKDKDRELDGRATCQDRDSFGRRVRIGRD
jgi:hypothetical protein